MKFIASIFIILAFTPQSEAGELWDFFRATGCPIYTDYILCAKANKENYYDECEEILTLSPAEDEKLALLSEDKSNEEDIKKLSNLNEYGREVVCPAPFFSWYWSTTPEEDAEFERKEKEWLDCLVEDSYPMFLEAFQCKELLKNSEPETNEPETNEPETNEPETKKNYKK